MATITRGNSFTNGELVTPAKLHALVDGATATLVAAEVEANNLAATLDLSTKTLTLPATQALSRPVLTGYRETVAAATGTSGTITLDLNTANIFTLTPAGNITAWTINNKPPTGVFGSFVLRITGNGTAYTYAWPATTKWAYGETPAVTSTSGKADLFSFFTFDGGTTWFAQPIGQNY